MAKINELIEWDYIGSKFSLYVKHFVDEEGRKGATISLKMLLMKK